jgi:CRISPR type III-A-associated protein Csm2
MTQYRQQRGRYPPGREQRPPSLPQGYLQDGYFDDNGNIRCDLLTQTAEQVAKVLGRSGVTSTQLRRFFTQVRSIERELGPKTFPKLMPQIQSLQPAVANYVGRGRNQQEREARENFKRFIDCNVELATRNEKNFEKGFIPHFESVVAYYKYHFPNK